MYAMTALAACTVSLVRMAVIGTMTFVPMVMRLDIMCMRVVVAFVFVLVVMVAMASVAVPMRVPAGGIGAVFRLKAFVYRVHDQVHGAQHVG